MLIYCFNIKNNMFLLIDSVDTFENGNIAKGVLVKALVSNIECAKHGQLCA